MSDAQQPPKSIAELLTEIDANIETLEQQISRLRSVRHILDDAAKNQTLSGHHLNAEALLQQALEQSSRGGQ